MLDIDKIGEGGYVQFCYFLLDVIIGLVCIDIYDVDCDDCKGMLLDLNFLGFIFWYYGFMDIVIVGVSWDFVK